MATPEQPVTSTTTVSPTGKPAFTLNGDSATIQAIVANAAFPSANATIATFSVAASAGPSVTIPTFAGLGGQSVPFQLSASAGATLAQYTDPAQLGSFFSFPAAAVKPLNLAFPADATKRYMALKCTYAVSASGSGTMALGPDASLAFGASASSSGEFAFVRAVDVAQPSEDACLALFSGWCTPAAIVNGGTLPAGFWIVTEVSGQVAANLGIQAGHDFSWVRPVQLGQLDGDIGLRIALAINATLSGSLSGSFLLVLNRETPTAGIRLRLFRNTAASWTFAVNASAAVNFLDPTSDTLEDLIKAIFGIQDAQLLAVLSANLSVASVANALGNDFLASLNVAGDVQQGLTDLSNLLTAFNNLPTTVATTLWKYADKIPQLQQIQQAAQQLSTLSASSLSGLLDTYLHDPQYFTGPVGEWLESAAGTTLFQLYEDVAGSRTTEIRTIASDAASVLDGSTLQTVLTGLKNRVSTVLDLSTLQTAASSGDLSGISVWVAQRLANFLGIDLSALSANIAKIDQAIAAIQKNVDTIYAETKKALDATYGLSLAGSYTASDTASAMLDVEFADAARPQLLQAIQGKLGDLLNGPAQPGVTMNVATLTHGISRHGHVELHLPWFSSVSDDLVSGSATGNFIQNVDGRLMALTGSGSDVNSLITTSAQRFATCNIGISATVKNAGVRHWNVQALDFGYSFLTAQTSMTVSQMTYAFGPAASLYFAQTFGAAGQPSFAGWVASLDKITDAGSTLPASSQVIGPVWANLQIQLRATGSSDWLTPLLNGTIQPNYQQMSLALQTSIRYRLLQSFTADPVAFGASGGTSPFGAALLLYASLPASVAFRIDPSGTELLTDGNAALYWDYANPKLVQLVCEAYGETNLQGIAASIYSLLSGVPGQQGNAGFYTPQQVSGIVQRVYNGGKLIQGTDPIMGLLNAEGNFILAANNALEKLRTAGSSTLTNSLPAFSNALAGLAQTFNSHLASLSLKAPQVMRNFAPAILQDALGAAGLGRLGLPDALLDVAVLQAATLPVFPATPAATDSRLRQRITNF